MQVELVVEGLAELDALAGEVRRTVAKLRRTCGLHQQNPPKPLASYPEAKPCPLPVKHRCPHESTTKVLGLPITWEDDRR